MDKYADKKKKSPSKLKKKKENTLDYYISDLPAGVNKSNWWDENNEKVFSDSDFSKRYEFLKKNIKISSIVPKSMKTNQETPNNMGFFETKFGTMAVGYSKYKKNSPIAFSLVPDSLKDTYDIPEKNINNPNTYFGGPIYGKNKKFKSSALAFKFDPRDKDDIQKLEEDNDGIKDTEEELLYQDKKEDDKIDYLRDIRNKNGVNEFKIDEEIEKIEDIKEEKKEDNLDFLKEIDDFVNKFRKGKLRKYVDSDDALSRRKRIVELSVNPDIHDLDIVELRELLKRILKKREYKEFPDEFSDLDLKSLKKEQLEEIINTLIKMNSES